MNATKLMASSLVTLTACAELEARNTPTIRLAPSEVRDERFDAIDFTTGEPVHTHSGPAVNLAIGCPTVFKYAYLMDERPPIFGSETTQNPLRWNFEITNANRTAYRVRSESGATLRDWTSMSAPYVELQRNDVVALGTTAGDYSLDIRAHDAAGNELIATWCWHHQPLAAPLYVDAAQSDAGSITQRIVQTTAEPIRLSLGTSAGAHLFDASGSELAFDNGYATIPPRAANEAPHEYRIEMTGQPSSAVVDLRTSVGPEAGGMFPPNVTPSVMLARNSHATAGHAHR